MGPGGVGNLLWPEFQLPPGYDSFSYLKKLCDEGYRARYGVDEAHREQLRYEQDMTMGSPVSP